MGDVVYRDEGLEEDGVKVEPLACVRRSVWGVLYTDDAGVASKWVEALANMITVVVTFFEAVGVTVPEKKTETMLLRTPNQALRTSPLVVEAAGQRYIQTMQFFVPGRCCRRKR